jgi:hypothetical protein
MSCGGGHLGFPIGIKNRNLVKDIPMIIHLQFGFSQFISFREEDLWNFSQSEHIFGPGSHVEYPTGTKNSNFVEDHPRNIPAKFGSNWPSGFGEDAWNVKSLQTTDAKYGNSSQGPGELIKRHSWVTSWSPINTTRYGNMVSPKLWNIGSVYIWCFWSNVPK